MSKAEERALEAYPISMTPLNYQDLIDMYGGKTEIDTNSFVRAYFQEGYQQAEKDLALTWEDVETINQLTSEVCLEFFGDPCGSEDFDREKTYTEVLRRFNEMKK